MPIVFDAPTVDFKVVTEARAQNGYAFMHTCRPRDGIDNAPMDVVDHLITKLEGYTYHLLVKEKEGLSSHLHWIVFHSQRITDVSNYKRGYGQAMTSPLHFMYHESPVPKGTEWYNFMHNCTKQLYNTDPITEYLSGHFDKKKDDHFEILSAYLPEVKDLSPYLTDPATLGKPAPVLNAWYKEYEKLFLDDHPDFDPASGVSELYLSQWYNTGVYVQRRFPVITPMRAWKEKIKTLQRFLNKYDGPGYGSFDSALRMETPVWPQMRHTVPQEDVHLHFEDEDRDYMNDNATAAERKNHADMCQTIH